jgi:hypothetical protein
MPNYDLNRLGDFEFERLCQSLLKEIIGSGTITFGDGPDGGREATFSGAAPYPSRVDRWEGEWIFQVKFHDVGRIGAARARQEVLTDLRSELAKVVARYGTSCENYILITNVPLSSVPKRGTHDRIAADVAPEYLESIPHIHVWGSDDICRFLETYPNVRQSYLSFLTPGDLIAQLMSGGTGERSWQAETMRLYVATSFNREQYAQLDQAGEVGEERMPLQKVFIDLGVHVRHQEDLEKFAGEDLPRIRHRELMHLADGEAVSAMHTLLSESPKKIVLIGGPGEGKSTLGQYLAQIHRATILNRLDELNGRDPMLAALIVRIPFRIVLRDYAQWLADSGASEALEAFLSDRVGEMTGREVTVEQIQEILRYNPSLFVFDGLDEVTQPVLQADMLARIGEFLARCQDVLEADIQVIATSRPTGYSDQFAPSRFLHLSLTNLDADRVREYVSKWARARGLDDLKERLLRKSIDDCLEDSQISLLMNTPLQVTILILIVLSGGTPPRQREALFNEYLEVIYKREKAKAKAIIQTEKQLLFGLHQYLGYVLQRRASDAQDIRAVLSEADFTEEVMTFLKFNDPFSDGGRLEEQVAVLVREARERLVLIVELEPGIFGFELRSLQEFFCAGHLTDSSKDSRQRFERFEPIIRPANWRNVALFFAGRVGRVYSGEAANILEVCKEADRLPPDSMLGRGARLALELAADRSFGPNRRLQRSAIEYGLSQLDSGCDASRIHEIESILARLPEEDIHDHVLPTLASKMSALKMPRLEGVLKLYHTFDPSGRPLCETIDAYYKSGDHRDAMFAIGECLALEIDPAWLQIRLQQQLGKVSADEFAEVFRYAALNNPQYLGQCLTGVDLEEEKVRALLKRAFASADAWMRSFVELRGVAMSADEISGPKGQMLLAFELLVLFNHIYSERRQFEGFFAVGPTRAYLPGRRPADETGGRAAEDLLENWVAALEAFVGRTPEGEAALMEELRVCYWQARMILDPQLAISGAFSEFYIEMRRRRPWVRSFFETYARSAHPLLPAVLVRIDEGSGESIVSANELLRRYWAAEETDQIRRRLRSILEDLDPPLAIRVALFGPRILGDGQLRERVERDLDLLLGPEYDLLFDEVVARGDEELILGVDEVVRVLESAESVAGLPWKWGSILSTIKQLCWVQWENGGEVATRCADILETMLRYLDGSPGVVGRSVSVLFLRLLDYGMPRDDLALPLMEAIGRNGRVELDAPFPFAASAEEVARAISGLEPYCRGENPSAKKGAARLLDTILDHVVGTSGEFRGRLEKGFPPIISLDIARSCFASDDGDLREIGIRLLALSEIPLREEAATLVAEILRTTDRKEAIAWCGFIELIGRRNGAGDQGQLIEFLRMVLEREGTLLRVIRSAALARYETLVTAATQTTIGDERRLGLPLSWL